MVIMSNKFTPEVIKELKSFLVERTVDNMSTEDLVAYVTADLDQYYKNMPEVEFLDIAENYWDDGFDDVVEEVKDYMKCDFKKDRRDDYLESLSEGKDQPDDYSSKVDALVNSMGVTDKEVSTS
tara:strand:- start:154 stop:525 length:372 start_codon:yes stop_codon:yes gene_type:complete